MMGKSDSRAIQPNSSFIFLIVNVFRVHCIPNDRLLLGYVLESKLDIVDEKRDIRD